MPTAENAYFRFAHRATRRRHRVFLPLTVVGALLSIGTLVLTGVVNGITVLALALVLTGAIGILRDDHECRDLVGAWRREIYGVSNGS